MKASEIKNLTQEELIKLLHDKQEEVNKLKLQHATGNLKQSHKVSQTKKVVARILTQLNNNK